MKRILLILGILLIAVICYKFLFKKDNKVNDDVKTGPLVARKHSTSFNGGIDSLLSAYFTMKDAFVNGDSNTAKAASAKLVLLADSGSLAELKKDTSGIYESALMQMSDVKANAESMVKQTDLTEMKQDFRMIGESIYPLLKTIHYDGKYYTGKIVRWHLGR